MFIKIGNRHINPANITFIEEVDERYKVHFTSNENAPLVITSGAFHDTSYQDLKAWLKADEGSIPHSRLVDGPMA